MAKIFIPFLASAAIVFGVLYFWERSREPVGPAVQVPAAVDPDAAGKVTELAATIKKLQSQLDAKTEAMEHLEDLLAAAHREIASLKSAVPEVPLGGREPVVAEPVVAPEPKPEPITDPVVIRRKIKNAIQARVDYAGLIQMLGLPPDKKDKALELLAGLDDNPNAAAELEKLLGAKDSALLRNYQATMDTRATVNKIQTAFALKKKLMSTEQREFMVNLVHELGIDETVAKLKKPGPDGEVALDELAAQFNRILAQSASVLDAEQLRVLTDELNKNMRTFEARVQAAGNQRP